MQDSERHDIYSDLLTVIEPPLKGDNPAEATTAPRGCTRGHVIICDRHLTMYM